MKKLKVRRRKTDTTELPKMFTEPWSYWRKIGVPNTTKLRDLFARNRGRKGDWIFELLLAIPDEDTQDQETETDYNESWFEEQRNAEIRHKMQEAEYQESLKETE